VFTAHFRGHLDAQARSGFLAESRRVARELVVVDSSLRSSELDEACSPRVLDTGSRWEVYKRWFEAEALADELSGGDVLLDGHWFVVVRTSL
jgi:hypothetical protein